MQYIELFTYTIGFGIVLAYSLVPLPFGIQCVCL